MFYAIITPRKAVDTMNEQKEAVKLISNINISGDYFDIKNIVNVLSKLL